MKNKVKKTVITIIIVLLLLTILAFIGVYLGNNDFRVWADSNILGKNVEDKELPTIELNSNENTGVNTYGNYVVTLENNTLTIYNKSAKKIGEIGVSVSEPLFKSSSDYLLIADKGGKKLYLVYNDSLQWEKEVDGQIAEATVNRNGAVGVIITGTSYKSVVIMYDITGKENFKTFLSTTSATDLSISDDNNYLSFIEINTSGATISSKIKTIDAQKALTNPNESIINTYEVGSDILLIKLKYRNNKIVAFANDGVYLCENGAQEKVIDASNTSFIDINLDGYIASIREEQNGKYELDLTNVENAKAHAYLIDDAIKNIYCNANNVAIDFGNKVEFVSSSGWLEKSFSAKQNIKDIIVGKGLAAIVYKDKIEILDL